ncbi:MAG: CHAT domain-containing protein [Anaerolineae bacterium]|nr:CHAT domain-containing protein [Anaerolineae bacterium]
MGTTADIELTIHRHDLQGYAVDFRYSDSDPQSQSEVRLGAGQAASAVFDFSALDELLESGDLKAYGQSLTRGLFESEALRTAMAQARAAVEQMQGSLRLRLNIHSGAGELNVLRWETLLDPQSEICFSTDQNIHFSRYLASMDWRPVRLRAKGELKALVMVAAPGGLEAYKLASVDKTSEITSIATGLGQIPFETLEQATLNNLISALQTDEFDILHIVAHGTFVNGESFLWLESEDGSVARVAGNELVMRLREVEHRPRLAVLASCQSAGRGKGDVLTALGPRLAAAGIPAVLAMQDNLSMETNAKLMPIFFSELQKDGQIDRALSVARGQVRERPDWWVPALFMRLKSGRLWYTPGFGGPRGEFEKWPSLLRGIQSGRCTPILGPGLNDPLIGSMRDLAQRWADELEYPLAAHERESLPQVAQFRAVDQSRFTAEDEWLAHLRAAIQKRASLPDELNGPNIPLGTLLEAARQQILVKDEFETYKILAQIPAKVFITANTDELLEVALREAGKEPTTMVCPWHEFSEKTDPSMYSQDDDFEPAAERPLVYHLFGLLSQPESLVLTEDDTFGFLIGITRHMKNIPSQVGRALADSALLFLGFQAEDWDFRVVMQSLLAKEGNNLLRRHAHIAAQIEPDEARLIDPGRARRYLETYFGHSSDIEISIFWGTAREFMKELAARLSPLK